MKSDEAQRAEDLRFERRGTVAATILLTAALVLGHLMVITFGVGIAAGAIPPLTPMNTALTLTAWAAWSVPATIAVAYLARKVKSLSLQLKAL